MGSPESLIMEDIAITLAGVFLSAFLAATLLPAQSEMVLAGAHLAYPGHVWLFVGVATFGNVLGAVVNWLLGRYLIRFKNRKWFPIRKHALQRATGFYQKYGIWTLLLAWMPIIGDPLTLVAGVFRTQFIPFVILVSIGKAGRYIGVVALI